jgi:tRNA(adenine34) deaminase
MNSLDHERYMRRAIELAGNVPELPFAAVIVDSQTGHVVAEGWNQTARHPIWHGEMVALHALTESAVPVATTSLVLYTTAEPCPMCQGAILWSGLGGVVFGTSIRTLQQLGWRQIDILAEEVIRRSPGWHCNLLGGVLEQDCDALFERVGMRPD